MKKYLIVLLFIFCLNIYSKECVIEQKITYLRSGTTYYSFLCSDKTIINDVQIEKFYSLKEKEVYIYGQKEPSKTFSIVFFCFFVFLLIVILFLGIFG